MNKYLVVFVTGDVVEVRADDYSSYLGTTKFLVNKIVTASDGTSHLSAKNIAEYKTEHISRIENLAHVNQNVKS